MILQALKEYYDRKAADPDSGIAPEGWENKEIRFVLTLDKAGHPILLEDTEEIVNKKKRSKRFLIPQSVKRSSKVVANLLWDNPEYVLGIDLKGDSKKALERFTAFRHNIDALAVGEDEGIVAVKAFLARSNPATSLEPYGAAWEALKESGGNLTFRLQGDFHLICNRPAVKSAIDQARGMAHSNILCLVTGSPDVLAQTHAAIKGVWGAQSSGANIVSFNASAFRSYGKEQGANAPVGQSASFAYTTALNTLLGKDSSQRLQVGEASTVFWSDRETDFEDRFAAFFAEPPKDDPDQHVAAVQALLEAPKTGALPGSDGADVTFFVLGLSPNASRIAIRFWIKAPLPEMQAHVRQHFEDLQIVHGPKEKPILSLFRLLLTTATQGKADNIPPNLEGDMIRAILEGLPYPASILQAAIRRIKAERDIPFVRAALVKACINRRTRFGKQNPQEELSVSLDTANPSVGYRLGRLFAVLEKIQEEANPGITATIRDRYYAAASSSPVTVFGRLMTLKNHHLSKLESPGRRINLERLIGEIVSDIGDFPAHLNLDEQGRFAIGYYHQRQEFFTKKDKQD
jgi:CRISPR-associated protein Csd1